MHRFDPGPIHLGDVGRVDENEGDDPPERGGGRDPVERERRGAEAEEGDHEDRGDAPKEVGVSDRQHAHGEENRARKSAQDGEQQREDEDERLRDQKDLHVEQVGA